MRARTPALRDGVTRATRLLLPLVVVPGALMLCMVHSASAATNITIIATGTGNLDSLLSPTNGTIITANDSGDIGATLSKAALQGVGASVPISISADATITFQDIGTLSLQSGPGITVVFQTTTGAISFANALNTVTTSGGNIQFTSGTNVTVCNLNSMGGDVSLTAGAGNLQFGSILTNGSGNLTLSATGGAITQSGSTAASGLSISTTATGSITVNSLRGSSVSLTSQNGSINSTGVGAIQASSQLTLTAVTGISVNTSASALQASNSVSGNLSVTQTASPAQTLSINGGGVSNSASGGTIVITNLGSSIAVGSGTAVASTNGAITLAALDFQINGGVNSGTAVTTLANSVGGTPIDVGTITAGKLSLTQADLDQVTAGVLRIGTNSAGSINVSAAITSPGSWNTLAVINGGTITEGAAGSLTVPNLRVSSTGPVSLFSANSVGTLASSTTFAISFSNGTHSLSIGVVDGTTGISAPLGSAVLEADNINVQQAINVGGSGQVGLSPFTTALPVNVGASSVPGVSFGITDAELAQVTASLIRILSGSSIAVDGLIARHTGYNTLSLLATSPGGAIVQSAGSLSVANLCMEADAGIGSAGAIQVVGPTNVAFLNNTANAVAINSTGAMIIASVDIAATSGNSAPALGGTTTLTATGPIIFNVSTTSVGNLIVTTTETGTETGTPLPPPDDDIILNNFLQSSGGTITFNSADEILFGLGSGVFGAGGVAYNYGVGDTDSDAISPPLFAASFGAPSILLNGSTSLTLTITNQNGGASLTGVAFTDTLPAGLIVATPNSLTNTCGGTATATAGSGSVTLSGGTVASAGATCTVALRVTATTLGPKLNITGPVSSTNGGTGNTASASLTVSNAARGDFNGDGKGDIMWHNTSTGDNSVWLMNGINVAASASLPTVANTSWQIAGFGDFNGDGFADVLWHNTVTGDNSVWFMSGPNVAVSGTLPSVPDTNWKIAGIGDFNGDGKADILWHNAVTGDTSVWLMNGINVAVSASLPTIANTNWVVAGIGDFNGDGKADILWHNTSTGDNSLWLINGINVAVSAALPSVPNTAWQIAGVGDLNGDGFADIVWRNSSTGDNSVWFMSGINVAVTGALPTLADLNWKIARITDFQGDGKADILWHNTVTGNNSVWLMNRINVAVSASLPTIANTNWQVAGPP